MQQRFAAGVIGLGMMGSGALRHLTGLLGGTSVIGIGPSDPPVFADHDGAFASHYDSGRITRVLDAHWQWGLLAQRAMAEYATIEAASGIDFHRPAGLQIGITDAEELAAVCAVGDRLGAPYRFVPAGSPPPELRYSCPADNAWLVEAPPAGHIDPLRMIAAQLAAAAAAGATVVRREASSIRRRHGGGWVVAVDGGEVEVEVDRLIVAAGPHTDELVGLPVRPALRVHAETIVMAHLGPSEAQRLAGLPSGIVRYAEESFYDDAYFVPPTRYPDGSIRFKLGATARDLEWLDTPSVRRAWMRGDRHLEHLPAMRRLVEDLIPGLVAERFETRPCMITQTPNRLPVVAMADDGLVLAAGGNGYAAKSGDALGGLAARLAVDGRWPDPEIAEADLAIPAEWS